MGRDPYKERSDRTQSLESNEEVPPGVGRVPYNQRSERTQSLESNKDVLSGVGWVDKRRPLHSSFNCSHLGVRMDVEPGPTTGPRPPARRSLK